MLSLDKELLQRNFIDVTYHTKTKFYPDGSWESISATRPVFRESGWELSDKSDSKAGSRKKNKDEQSLDRSRRRASARLRDYALCTPFKYFVTLTFSAEKVNRYDLQGILSKIRSWLDNRVRRNGLAYILVPELHKDGAVHFHGFFTDSDIGFVDSGTIDMDGWKHPKRPRSERERERWLANGGRVVYNISDWSYGFTTAIELYGEKAAAVGYCVKYVGKQKEKLGGRWYYSGGSLSLPTVVYYDYDYYDVVSAYPDSYTFEVEGANVAFVIRRGTRATLNFGISGTE